MLVSCFFARRTCSLSRIKALNDISLQYLRICLLKVKHIGQEYCLFWISKLSISDRYAFLVRGDSLKIRQAIHTSWIVSFVIGLTMTMYAPGLSKNTK